MKPTRIAISTTILSITLLIYALHFPYVASAAPVTLEEVNVSLDTTLENFPDGLMFVTAILPEETPLPAEVEVMIPAGREIFWAGEVLGGAPEFNPRVQYRRIPYSNNFETVSTTLTQSRTLQLEIASRGKMTRQDEVTEALIEWQAPNEIPIVRLGIVIPAGSAMTTGPANILVGSAGENKIVYYREHRDVAAGDGFELKLGFAPRANIDGFTGGPAVPQEHRGILFPIAVAVILAVVTGVLLTMAKNRREQESQ